MTAERRLAITSVQVVVPAHDEEERIGACLDSIASAIVALRRHAPAIDTRVLVVLDACRDRTAEIVEGSGVDAVVVDLRCVGATRHAGALAVASRDADSRTTLLVSTDADCVVPPRWLIELVGLASAHDLVLGEVEPDPRELASHLLAAWWERNPRGRGSLHGANLAVRLDAYLRVGGFPPVASREDAALVRLLRADGASVVGGTRVTTSARLQGRLEGGFAAYLSDLAEELDGECKVGPAGESPREASA